MPRPTAPLLGWFGHASGLGLAQLILQACAGRRRSEVQALRDRVRLEAPVESVGDRAEVASGVLADLEGVGRSRYAEEAGTCIPRGAVHKVASRIGAGVLVRP